MAASVKVFVGNLPFSTKDSDLSNTFAPYGSVVSATVITRGTRSLGYGFVEMATEADANKAVKALHKQTIGDREINVEVAKPRDEAAVAAAAAERQARRSRPRRAKAEGEGNNNNNNNNGGGNNNSNNNNNNNNNGGGENNNGGGARKRARRPRRRNNNNNGEGGNNNNNNNNNNGGSNNNNNNNNAGGERTRRSRSPRRPRLERTKEASTTTLFVANLPFRLTDEGLGAVFTSFGVREAHVVRVGRGRSKGFGFVEFNNNQGQQSALNGGPYTIEGRELVLRVAETKPITQEELAAVASPST